MELIKDYDCVIDYHPGKANVVADALSKKTMQTLRTLNAHLSLTNDGTVVTELIARPSLLNRVLEAQRKDEKIAVIVSRIGNGKEIEFTVNEDGVLYYKDRVCVPDDNDLRKAILEEAYDGSFAIYLGSIKMYQDLKMSFWWSGMKRDISKFVTKCLVCQRVKAEHQVPSGLLQSIRIPEWKWDRITMDFVVGLSLTWRKHDSVWVVVDRLTKSAHFLPMRIDYSLDKLAKLYIKEIVLLHGIPISIVSDRDPRFTSRFWGKLQEALGTRLNFSTAFHPQTDGQSERVIQIMEDMLRSCVIDYEALYGRKCRTPLCWTKLSEKKVIGPDLIQETVEKMKMIRERLKISNDRHKSYVDMKRKDIRYEIGKKKKKSVFESIALEGDEIWEKGFDI